MGIGLFFILQASLVVRSEETKEDVVIPKKVIIEDPPAPPKEVIPEEPAEVIPEEPAPAEEVAEEAPAADPLVTSTAGIITMGFISLLCIIGLWKKGQKVLGTNQGEQEKKEE